MIPLEEIIETHGPFDEGRSRVTAENKSDRPFSFEIRETNGILAVRVSQFEIRGDVPYLGRYRIVLSLPRPSLIPMFDKVEHAFTPLIIKIFVEK